MPVRGICCALWGYDVYLTILFLTLTVVTTMPMQEVRSSTIHKSKWLLSPVTGTLGSVDWLGLLGSVGCSPVAGST